MGRLEGKIAIITGSTDGIGEVAAHKFAQEGAAGVLVVGRNGERAANVAQAINAEGGTALACPTDVSRVEDVQRMVATAMDAWGRIDILVNNAAKTSNHGDMDIVNQDLDEWRKAFDVNATGAMLCCKYAIPHMIAAGGGTIVHSSSGLGMMADELYSGYSCSKAALMRMSQHIAATYGVKGIRSNTIIIGIVATDATTGMIPEPVLNILARNHLSGRFGTSEEIANVMAFLASDESSFINGTDVRADGGMFSHVPQMSEVRQWVEAQQG